jgi:hypothetical protein
MFWNAPNVKIVAGSNVQVSSEISGDIAAFVSPTLEAAFVDESTDNASASWLRNTPLAVETYEIVAPRTDLRPESTHVMMAQRHEMRHAFPELAFVCAPTKRSRDLAACARTVAAQILDDRRRSITIDDLARTSGGIFHSMREDRFAPWR